MNDSFFLKIKKKGFGHTPMEESHYGDAYKAEIVNAEGGNIVKMRIVLIAIMKLKTILSISISRQILKK